MKLRGADDWGAGHFGASRGGRPHNGVDIATVPGEPIYCYNRGEVTRLGYAYADDLKYRIVDITDGDYRWRYFYVEPTVKVGDRVEAFDQIGFDQNIAARYAARDPNRKMVNHMHLEIIGPDGRHIDPVPLVTE